MHEREVGDEVEIGELGGNLTLDDPTANVACVATGTGITPMAALIKQHVDVGEGETRLFFGERTEEDVIYRETFDQLAAQNASFEAVYSLSEPGEGWTGPIGPVQEHLPEELEELADWQFYVCGVPEMVVETKELLSEEGVPEEQVLRTGGRTGRPGHCKVLRWPVEIAGRGVSRPRSATRRIDRIAVAIRSAGAVPNEPSARD